MIAMLQSCKRIFFTTVYRSVIAQLLPLGCIMVRFFTEPKYISNFLNYKIISNTVCPTLHDKTNFTHLGLAYPDYVTMENCFP